MNPDELIPPEFKRQSSYTEREATINIARGKLDAIYAREPSAKEEIKEVKTITSRHGDMSKHQLFMKELVDSGRSQAEIQNRWHAYYESLPDHEKHEVWEEFYAEQEKLKKAKPTEEKKKPSTDKIASLDPDLIEPETRAQKTKRKAKKIKDNHHVKSLIFGFSFGFLVIFILLFSFFNERFLVPFIRPNTNVSATPIIVDSGSGPVGPESKIIIPKINLEAPVVYDVATIEEKAVQEGLERGVLHYATTPNPGENGNAVIFGHSSGNILNKGKYKFAFILLKSLDEGDTFIVQKDGKRYVYKIFNKYVTVPEDVSVLGPGDRPAMMTLITCDPPGTSSNRLIIQAEQIFPDPKTNKKSSVPETVVSQPQQLPSNSRSLWDRIFN